MNIYIANLHPHINEEHLKDAFSPYGEIESAKVIVDLETGVSKGYGFVSMPNDEHAKTAIAQLGGAPLMGQAITVREANPPGIKKKVLAPNPSNQNRVSRYQPPMPVQNNLQEGKIKFFNDEKGYGFIIHNDQDIFFQKTSLNNPDHIPQKEQPVAFRTKNTPRGTVAIDISLK